MSIGTEPPIQPRLYIIRISHGSLYRLLRKADPGRDWRSVCRKQYGDVLEVT